MLISSPIMRERAVSAFPISIGTSLALESIMEGIQQPYDPARVIPEKINLTQYREFWINVETLFRNIMGSVSAALQKQLMAAEVLEVLLEEMSLIRELVLNHTHDKVKVVFYRNVLSNLEKAHPHATLMKPITARQMEYHHICDAVVSEAIEQLKNKNPIESFDRILRPTSRPKALFITHIAYDLLSQANFDDVGLLESHTGVLKKRTMWYTKYRNSANLMRLPFNACMMQVFGDANTFIPMPSAIRHAVVDLSEKYRWHTLTTKDRLILSFESLQDNATKVMLKEMLSEG